MNLNIGRIEGGDWASSVPAWSTFDVRMEIYPGDDLDTSEQKLRDCIAAAASGSDYLRENPPEIVCHGFRAEGYSLERDTSEPATNAGELLAAMHQIVSGSPTRADHRHDRCTFLRPLRHAGARLWPGRRTHPWL
ncbi:peptidase dimerization domain-containing protein [Mesorhizobium sp. LNJC384A00]|uniref:peptidase dimerization domain-containing protein n=1 Tax=Mesorhizobium sp. LNJC384A00 TaxID=1287268 RepID=UPI001FD8FCEC|nr:peptidase dimerization domain-containing protein [Mesorhizobium sp. LNJC384A00]